MADNSASNHKQSWHLTATNQIRHQTNLRAYQTQVYQTLAYQNLAYQSEVYQNTKVVLAEPSLAESLLAEPYVAEPCVAEPLAFERIDRPGHRAGTLLLRTATALQPLY